MAGPTVNQPQQIQADSPGVAMVGPNTRVKGQPGFLGTQVDALMFSSGSTGIWVAPNTRTRTSGVFLVSQSSQGTAVTLSGSPSPVIVTSGDGRIRSQ